MRRFYLVTRDLHLYAGLFISPFVLLFAVTVFYLVHGWSSSSGRPSIRTLTGVDVPSGLAALQGRARLDALKPVLDAVGVGGEVDFVRHIASERRFVIPVRVPGRVTTVDLDYGTGSATITVEGQSFAERLIYLHKVPGPHNADLRGNSGFMRAWRVLADATAYLVLFVTLSGVYLWYVLKAERRVGLALLAAGGVSFAVLVDALTR